MVASATPATYRVHPVYRRENPSDVTSDLPHGHFCALPVPSRDVTVELRHPELEPGDSGAEPSDPQALSITLTCEMDFKSALDSSSSVYVICVRPSLLAVGEPLPSPQPPSEPSRRGW